MLLQASMHSVQVMVPAGHGKHSPAGECKCSACVAAAGQSQAGLGAQVVLGEPLGAGAFGAVYKGEQTAHDPCMATLVMHDSCIAHWMRRLLLTMTHP